MRVALAGVGATGKSTLARYISEKYDLPINPVGSRSTAKAMGFVGPDGEGRPYDVDKASVRAYRQCLEDGEDPAIAAGYAVRCGGGSSLSCRPLFQTRLQADKLAWEAAHDAFVTDRTPFDDAAYALLHCPEVVTSTFVDAAMAGFSRYDVVFFCPRSSGQWLNDDPARQGDADYYLRLETVLRGFLSTASEHETIRGPDGESRRAHVDRFLGALRA
jgi:hypothetical protein